MSRPIDADALKDWLEIVPLTGDGGVDINDLVEHIAEMPAAQPEIIRCAECKWYGRADKRRFYRGTDCLQNRIDTIVPDKDFCSRAERREG